MGIKTKCDIEQNITNLTRQFELFSMRLIHNVEQCI